MKRRAIRISPRAGNDIRSVAEYLAANGSPAVATGFEDDVYATLMRVAELPHLGHRYARSRRVIYAIRVSQRFRHYMIFYEDVDSRTLRVVRVLHGARDLTNLLKHV